MGIVFRGLLGSINCREDIFCKKLSEQQGFWCDYILFLNEQYLLSAPVFKIFKIIKKAEWIRHVHWYIKAEKKLSMPACLIHTKNVSSDNK